MASYDVAVIGGGIIGTSAATYLARAGASVALIESDRIAAAASGRNSGAIQHPFDRPLAALHARSLELYRELAVDGFALPIGPAGLLLVSADAAAAGHALRDLTSAFPELRPELVAAPDLRAIEPGLAADLLAVRVETGYPVEPEAATLAFAAAAERAGAQLIVGRGATLEFIGSTVDAVVLADGERLSVGRVLVAAGPWTNEVLGPRSDCPLIGSTWGVAAQVAVERPPLQVIEELGIDRPGRPPETLFSMISADGRTGVGSTFLVDRPEPMAWQERLIERGARFVPALKTAKVIGLRACARPVTNDGRPLIGRVPGLDNVFVCAGHGPWGISTGPASAAAVVALMLGSGSETDDFSPSRASARLVD